MRMAHVMLWTAGLSAMIAAAAPAEFGRGVEAQQNGDHRTAIGLFTAALKSAPQTADIWFRRATSYHKLSQSSPAGPAAAGLLDTALADVTRANELDTANANAWNLRGTIHLARSLADQAVGDFTAALKINPRFAAAARGRAAAAQQLGRTDEALADLNTAVELSPHDHTAYSDRAELHAAKGQWLEAAADYSSVLEIVGGPYSKQAEETRARALKARGDCRLHLGELGKALSDHRSALSALGKEGPADVARAWAERAAAVARQGKPDSAAFLYGTAIEFNAGYMTAYAGRARAHFSTGRYDKVLADCDTVLAHNPESYLDYLLRGQARDKLGRVDSAAADYARALDAAKKAGEATDSLVKVIRGLQGKR